jgi:hypothetical protein
VLGLWKAAVSDDTNQLLPRTKGGRATVARPDKRNADKSRGRADLTGSRLPSALDILPAAATSALVMGRHRQRRVGRSSAASSSRAMDRESFYLLRALPRAASLVDPWWTLEGVDQGRGVESVPALCLG